MAKFSSRSAIPSRYTWNTRALFESPEEWEATVETLKALVAQLDRYRGQMTTEATTLLAGLNHQMIVLRISALVRAYARMKRDENVADQGGRSLLERARRVDSRVQSVVKVLEREIRDMDRGRFETFTETRPQLGIYEHYFDDVSRMDPHTPSPEVESLLMDLKEVAYGTAEVYTLLSNSDISYPSCELPDGTSVEVTLDNFTSLQRHQSRTFRKEVYEAFYDRWGDFRGSVSAAYRTTVKADRRFADARDYETTRQMKLDESNVPTAVHDRLVDAVRDELDTFHAHLRLKRRRLDVDELRPWDLYASPVAGNDSEISFEEATELLLGAVEPLGDRYRTLLQNGLDSRWVDVYPTPNKKSGAYSVVTYDTRPYVLLNYRNDLPSLYTLAHEIGHAMHTQLATETQPYVYSEYDAFIGEIASTVNELLLTEYLLDSRQDGEFESRVLDEILERFRVTLLRQTMFSEFEHRVHEHVAAGGTLTADLLDELFRDLKAKYYAPMSMDDLIEREWMGVSHFHRSYKVYRYATGISVAVSFLQRLLGEEGPNPREQYLQFLRAGGSEYPLALLSSAGVDLGTKEPIARAFDQYAKYVDRASSVERRQ